jgi:hypothetical protein
LQTYSAVVVAELTGIDPARVRELAESENARRGVWESGWWLGPTVSLAHSAEDVDRYVAVFDDFLSASAGASARTQRRA